MLRMGVFKIALTAALFGLLSANPLSIGLVKAGYHFPHRAAVTSQNVAADQLQNVRSDHVALLIANANYPDADAAMGDVTAGADALSSVLRDRGFFVVLVRD